MGIPLFPAISDLAIHDFDQVLRFHCGALPPWRPVQVVNFLHASVLVRVWSGAHTNLGAHNNAKYRKISMFFFLFICSSIFRYQFGDFWKRCAAENDAERPFQKHMSMYMGPIQAETVFLRKSRKSECGWPTQKDAQRKMAQIDLGNLFLHNTWVRFRPELFLGENSFLWLSHDDRMIGW